MVEMLNNAIEKKFMPQSNMDLFFVSDNTREIIEFLENYKPDNSDITNFKKLVK